MSTVDRSGTERIRRLRAVVSAQGPAPTIKDYDTYEAIKFGRTPYITLTATGAVVEESCCSVPIPAPAEPMILRLAFILLDGLFGIELPFVFGPGNSITVDWGDGSSNTYTATPVAHTYSTGGIYTVSISGSASRFGRVDGYDGAQYITDVLQWGTLGLTSLAGAFFGGSSLVSVPSTLPSEVTDTSYMFASATSFNQDLSGWNVSNVENMAGMFAGPGIFDGNISGWNVSNVTNMQSMFAGPINFNQDLSGWDVSNVENMAAMFNAALNFNQDLSGWNVGKVTDMSTMFGGALIFNQDLSEWNVDLVTDAIDMFATSGMCGSLAYFPLFAPSVAGYPFFGCPSLPPQWPMFRYNALHTGRTNYPSVLNGTLKWSYTAGGAILPSPAISANGTIYVGTQAGKFYAFNTIGIKILELTVIGQVSSPAIAVDGTFYFGAFTSFYAYDPTGTQLWTVSTNSIIQSIPTIAVDGTIYFGTITGTLYAVAPNGNQLWTVSIGDNGIVSSPAIAADGTIYVGTYNGNLYAYDPTGTQLWTASTGSLITSSPAIAADGTIYVGTYNGNLYAYDPTGTQLWTASTGATMESSPAIATDGTIYVGSYDGNLYAYDPTGTQLWTASTGGSIQSSPAIATDGTIYVGSFDGKLYAFDPSDGHEIWAASAGGTIRSSPAIAADGTIYIGASTGLYAFH